MIKTSRAMWVIAIAALLLAASACDSVPDFTGAEASPSATVVRNVLATRQKSLPIALSPTAAPIQAPTLAPTAAPTLSTPAPPPPTIEPTIPSTDGFCCLYFAAGPYAQATETFSAGTEIIYAIWDYNDLAPGDRVRRIWIRDDLIWLTREEKWDWDKYGPAGTVRDLSIFDFEGSGLQPAAYRLQIYLNDTLQEEAAFNILPP